MDIPTLRSFLLWCLLINSGLLLCWTAACMAVPDLVYRVQHRFFPLKKEQFTVTIYAFLGLFKLLIIFFNLVPLLALLIIG